MAAVASIESELKNLSLASKRHNSELSQSASESLSILEAASQSYDDDQLAIRSLRKYERFVTPFILACSEASAKSCASALQCIQTLASFQGITPSRLHELLQALMEATQLGLGIQLKILQVLPVMLQSFATDLSGTEVVELLQVCAVLLEGKKVAMVHNAARATLQQLISGVFDRVNSAGGEADATESVHVDVTETVSFEVTPVLHDALMVLLDLCNFAEDTPRQFLKINGLSLKFTLDLLEHTLSNQAALIHKHEEFAAVLRFRLTPVLLRLFSEAGEFPIFLRVVRIFYLLLRQHLSILITESEVILSTLATGAKQTAVWKKVICLEVIQGVLLETQLLYQIYKKFDAEEGRTNIIGNLTSLFADTLTRSHGLMLASDVPPELALKLSGSSSPTQSDDSSSEDSLDESAKVLSKASVPHIQVIEMLDPAEPPAIKPIYSYYLVVKCANALTDDVHKLISTKGAQADILVSLSTPLLKCHAASMSIAMDIELFRLVVRSVQRLAHAAGIVGKTRVRDEFISLLIQYCHVPETAANESNEWAMQRCSLCVRALFNLGYALGNQLDESWALLTSVIFTLAQEIGTTNATLDAFYGQNHPDCRTINVSLTKLLESTQHLSDFALINLVTSLGASTQVIKYKLIEFVAKINALRFGNANSKCWSSLASILLRGVKDSNETSAAANTLNDTALTIMEAVLGEGYSSSYVDKSLAMILQSECLAVTTDNAQVRVTISEHVYMLLEKFGANISQGWVYVLDYISAVPASDDFQLMHSTFETVELICSDFLDHVPYPQVFNLTLCLDEFARQTIDLNTAFTATSLFWLICDHLMKGTDIGRDLDPSTISTEQDLIQIARDNDAVSKRFALWLFAVLKLASISGAVTQQQVRTSAIQIFLRLFNTHGSQLPSGVWDVVPSLVFPVLLKANEAVNKTEVLSETQESRILLINGLTKIITQFFPQLRHGASFGVFLKQWMHFLKNSVELSPRISLTVYKDLILILQADSERSISRKAVSEFWLHQNLRPQFGQDNPRATAEALTEFVSLYPYIKDFVDASSALKVLAFCAKFPYYTTPAVNPGEFDMSVLQSQATEQLDAVPKNGGDPQTLPEFLLLLNEITLLPFENELRSGNPKFTGIAQWSLDRMIRTFDTLEIPLSEEVMKALPTVVSGMNRVLVQSSDSGDKTQATKIIIESLGIASSLEFFDRQTLVDSFKLILGSSDNDENEQISTVIGSTEKLINILKDKAEEELTWKDILRILMNYSILYERSVHNRRFYEQEEFTDGGKALRFGTVEAAVQIHKEEVSFFCLDKLLELSNDSKVYSENAQKFFVLRVNCILNQYIGDCGILGKEPMRNILHKELVFILKQLSTWSSSSRSSLDPSIQRLVLMSVTKAHADVLPLLQTILTNMYE